MNCSQPADIFNKWISIPWLLPLPGGQRETEAEAKGGPRALCKSPLPCCGTVLPLAARTNAHVWSVLQLAGIAVLAVGLWLRFDSQTKSIFEQDTQPSSFYTGEVVGGWGCLVLPLTVDILY